MSWIMVCCAVTGEENFLISGLYLWIVEDAYASSDICCEFAVTPHCIELMCWALGGSQSHVQPEASKNHFTCGGGLAWTVSWAKSCWTGSWNVSFLQWELFSPWLENCSVSLQETGLTIVSSCYLDFFSCSVPVASFMSSFPVTANTKKQEQELVQPRPCVSESHQCVLAWLLGAAAGTKEATELSSNAAVVTPFRCSLCVLLCGAIFLSFVLALHGEIYLEIKLHM